MARIINNSNTPRTAVGSSRKKPTGLDLLHELAKSKTPSKTLGSNFYGPHSGTTFGTPLSEGTLINTAAKNRAAATARQEDWDASRRLADEQAAAYGLSPEPQYSNSGGGNARHYSSGGGGVQSAAISAIQQAQAKAEGGIKDIQTKSGTAYDEALADIRKQREASAKERQAPYDSAVKGLADNLDNLGINFRDGDLAKSWDSDQRRLQENADQALADDVAWFDKMKTTQQETYNALLVELAQQAQLQAAAARSSGGGGGGGGGSRHYSRSSRSGGSSSSGDTSDTLNEDYSFYNPELRSGINSLPANQRAAANALADLYGGDPILKGIAQQAQKLKTQPLTPYKASWNPVKSATNIGRALAEAAKNRQEINNLQSQQSFFRKYSPNYGPMVTKQSRKVTNKRKS